MIVDMSRSQSSPVNAKGGNYRGHQAKSQNAKVQVTTGRRSENENTRFGGSNNSVVDPRPPTGLVRENEKMKNYQNVDECLNSSM